MISVLNIGLCLGVQWPLSNPSNDKVMLLLLLSCSIDGHVWLIGLGFFFMQVLSKWLHLGLFFALFIAYFDVFWQILALKPNIWAKMPACVG